MLKKKHKPRKKAAHKRKKPGFLRLFQIAITDQHGTTSVHPDPQNISVKLKDEVVWHGAAAWSVNFNGENGSPFDQTYFAGGPGESRYSGSPTNARPGVDYKYTAQIGNAAAVDPIIHTGP